VFSAAFFGTGATGVYITGVPRETGILGAEVKLGWEFPGVDLVSCGSMFGIKSLI